MLETGNVNLEQKLEDATEEKEKKQENESEVENKEKQSDSGERFYLAKVLGKTESGLKSEFYDYQIKGFMAKTGWFNPEIAEDLSDSDEFLKVAKSGVLECAVTPYFFGGAKNAIKRAKSYPLKLTAVLDFPKGESSYYARLADAKQAVKGGFNSIMLTLPSVSLFIKNPSKIKAQLNRISRVTKSRLGIIVKPDSDMDKFKKALAHLMSVKAERLVLTISEKECSDFSSYARTALTYAGKKKIFVLTDTESAEKVADLISLKVDGVYLKNPLVVCKTLQEKFSVTV